MKKIQGKLTNISERLTSILDDINSKKTSFSDGKAEILAFLHQEKQKLEELVRAINGDEGKGK